ncbi:hypothetical protein Tco_1239054, partial [Tanacetum coccineum]
MEEDTDEDSIDYPDEPEDGKDDDDEDPKEDPSEDNKPEDDDEDPEEDPNEEHEPEDEDTKEEEPFESSDKSEPFKEDETAALIDVFAAGSPLLPLPSPPLPLPSPPPSGPTYNQALLDHRVAMIRMRDDIPEEDMPPQRRFVLTAPPPGCDVAESSVAAAARAPRRQYDFVYPVKAGQGLIRSPGHDARTIARAADRVEDVGYVRRQESVDFYTQLLDARTDRIDIRLEIDVVKGQRIAYKTELHKVLQAYLSSEAQNRALLARIETLETHMSRTEWQRQRA